MSECNKCNGTLFVCENHPDQEAHQCKHCGGAGMPCECTKISEPIGNIKQLAEPVAVRYDFDGYGYIYMDAGSGSDWASRVKNCEFLYTHPMREWISVKDRLPLLDQRFKTFSIEVLFCHENNICVGAYCYRNKKWINNGEINENNVTHWMPLPNPPMKAREK